MEKNLVIFRYLLLVLIGVAIVIGWSYLNLWSKNQQRKFEDSQSLLEEKRNEMFTDVCIANCAALETSEQARVCLGACESEVRRGFEEHRNKTGI